MFAISTLIAYGKAIISNVKQLGKLKNIIKKITDLNGESLDKVTSKIKAMSDAYQKDTQKMSEAANNLSKQMEIDFTTALDLIEQGFLDGADANGDFLDKVREYPVLLKETGLSAEQSIALMTQEIKEGIYSDKGVDAIKEANLRLREMPKSTIGALKAIGLSSKTIQKELKSGSKTIFDIIQQVSKSMAALPPQSKEVGQAIADIFGGPGEDAGLKYLSNLHKIDLSLGSIKYSTDKYTEAKKLEVKANEALNNVWVKLSETGSTLSVMYNSFKLGLADLLGTITGVKDESLEARNAFDGQAKSVISLDRNLVPLVSEYDKLKSKTKLTKKEQSRLKTVISKIGGIVPTAITAFDEYGQALDISSSKALEFIETQKTLLKYKNGEVIEEQTEKLADLNKELKKNKAILNNRNEKGDIVKVRHTFTKTDRLIVSEEKLGGKEISRIQARQLELQKSIKEHQTILDAHNGDYLEKAIKKQETQTNKTASEIATRELLEKSAAKYRIKNIKTLTDEQLKMEIELAIQKANALADLTEKNSKEKLSPEDKKIIASKKKLAEFLKEWDEEQAIQKELKDLEGKEREEEEEILRLEKKFTDMENEAGLTQEKEAELSEEDKALKVRIEKSQQEQIQAIKDKYKEKRLKDKKLENKKHEKLTKEHHKKLVKAETKLELAKKKALDFGISSLKDMFGKKTGIYKALFVLEKALAINDVLNNASKSIAQITANTAIANAKAVAASPLTAGMPFVAMNTSLGAKEVLSTKLMAGVQIGQIAASSVKGFEKGLYKELFPKNLYPVTREDGKKFNARLGGPTRTQIVSEPTLIQEYLVGERRRPEMIIDDVTFSKLDPGIIKHILDLHNGTETKTPGFEKGNYTRAEEISENFIEQDTEEDSSIKLLQDISSKLSILLDKEILAKALIGDDAIEALREREEQLQDSRTEAKIQ